MLNTVKKFRFHTLAMLGIASLFAYAGVAQAGDKAAPSAASSKAPPALTAKQVKQRMHKLRQRADRWQYHRQNIAKTCHQCDGRARLHTPHGFRRKAGAAPRSHWLSCPTCRGTGIYISRRHFEKAHFKMKSPAFRGRLGAERTFERLYEETRQYPEEVARKRGYRFQDAQLVDAIHAIFWHRVGPSAVQVASLWIWARQGRSKPTWYRYDGRSDGEFPGLGRIIRPSEAEQMAAERAAAESKGD